MRCTIAFLAACALALPVAPLPGQTSDSLALIRRVAGCYRLTLSPSPGWRAQASQTPPERFRLDSMMRRDSLPHVLRSELHLGVEPRVLESRSLMEASWHLIGRDSIQVAWSTGFSGVILRLRIQPDELVGRARTFVDLIPPPGAPPEPDASVVARRVSCDTH